MTRFSATVFSPCLCCCRPCCRDAWLPTGAPTGTACKAKGTLYPHHRSSGRLQHPLRNHLQQPTAVSLQRLRCCASPRCITILLILVYFIRHRASTGPHCSFAGPNALAWVHYTVRSRCAIVCPPSDWVLISELSTSYADQRGRSAYGVAGKGDYLRQCFVLSACRPMHCRAHFRPTTSRSLCLRQSMTPSMFRPLR